jgi:poly-gamma-glutamate synthesis protein (capsule biosynthesis protein)
LAPYLPAALRSAVTLPVGWQMAESPEAATLRLEVGNANPVSQWVYAVAAPFPTIADGVSTGDLMNAWIGGATGPLAGRPILMDESTYVMLSLWWGTPASEAVTVLPAAQLLDTAWATQPSWAIIPFDAIEPRWKVLEVDGQSPIHKDFDPNAYILTIPFSLNGAAATRLGLPPTNRDPAKMTIVVTTGVTALVRATAWTMEREGILYPAQDIRGWLNTADITHVSNEIAFDPECPRPDPSSPALIFCSAPGYIDLLADIGADVVELTGDHFIDRGPEALLYTLELYTQRGWQHYGGGANLEDGRKAALFEHNGNQIAFIGCNAKGGGYALADADTPGAVACDLDWLRAETARLTGEGYQVIVTFQHQEYYSYKVKSEYRPDFTSLAESGAVIVQGSQAHQPQNFEFYPRAEGIQVAFIHYGLGNLFFDQVKEVDGGGEHIADKAFIDRHVFYAGQHIGTELLTTQFIDMARSRPMTAEERAAFLQILFKASGWSP